MMRMTEAAASKAIETAGYGWALPIPAKTTVYIRPPPAGDIDSSVARESKVVGNSLPTSPLRDEGKASYVDGCNPRTLMVWEVWVIRIVLWRFREAL